VFFSIISAITKFSKILGFELSLVIKTNYYSKKYAIFLQIVFEKEIAIKNN